ncbi:hypothetical protein [Kingella oralis]|uniref:hypothetical protein n=1 Tax=Kingella oralis TaxID=505 RepID=UPI0034E47C24
MWRDDLIFRLSWMGCFGSLKCLGRHACAAHKHRQPENGLSRFQAASIIAPCA